MIQLGFDNTQETNEVLDKAEQKIFDISQEKPTKGLTPAAEILTSTFNEIEARSLGKEEVGIKTLFYYLLLHPQNFPHQLLNLVCQSF